MIAVLLLIYGAMGCAVYIALVRWANPADAWWHDTAMALWWPIAGPMLLLEIRRVHPIAWMKIVSCVFAATIALLTFLGTILL